jgi:hypothetical protein
MSDGFRAALGALACLLAVLALGPYLVATWRGVVRPPLASWIAWSATAATVGVAQVVAAGGPGAWATLASAALAAAVAGATWRRGGGPPPTWMDRACLGVVAIALPLWAVTGDPLIAVLLVAAADLAAFAPAARVCWHRPLAQDLRFYATCTVRNGLIIAALASWSATTLVYPVAVGVACAGMVALIGLRRRQG